MVESTQEASAVEGTPERRARPLHAVKGVFAGEFSEIKGAVLVLLDPRARKIERVFCVVVPDNAEFRFSTVQPWKAFEDGLITAKLTGNTANQMSVEVQDYIKQSLQDVHLQEVLEASTARNNPELTRIFEEIISRSVADSHLTLAAECEQFEEILETPKPAAAETAGTEISAASDAEGDAQARVARMEIKVDPVFSPVHGAPARSLKPGMTILVGIRETATFNHKNIRRLLETRFGKGKLDQVEATVQAVETTETKRINIRVELAPNVHGVTNVAGDLRLKLANKLATVEKISEAPSAVRSMIAEKMEKGIATGPFVALTIFVVTSLGLLAYLFFGG